MEKPILFNTEMVKAILEGRKTCTRRISKNVIAFDEEKELFNLYKGGEWIGATSKHTLIKDYAPYKVGDILYVRETWTTIENFKNYADVEMDKNIKYLYKCDDNGKEHVFIDVGVKKWKPSIHMPKVAARIFLKVINVRVERLKDITEEGAKAEGATKQIWYQPYGTRSENNQEYVGDITHHEPNYITGFAGIWDRTLGKYDDWLYAFKENPWVWVIEFERMIRNVHICN